MSTEIISSMYQGTGFLSAAQLFRPHLWGCWAAKRCRQRHRAKQSRQPTHEPTEHVDCQPTSQQPRDKASLAAEQRSSSSSSSSCSKADKEPTSQQQRQPRPTAEIHVTAKQTKRPSSEKPSSGRTREPAEAAEHSSLAAQPSSAETRQPRRSSRADSRPSGMNSAKHSQLGSGASRLTVPGDTWPSGRAHRTLRSFACTAVVEWFVVHPPRLGGSQPSLPCSIHGER